MMEHKETAETSASTMDVRENNPEGIEQISIQDQKISIRKLCWGSVFLSIEGSNILFNVHSTARKVIVPPVSA